MITSFNKLKSHQTLVGFDAAGPECAMRNRWNNSSTANYYLSHYVSSGSSGVNLKTCDGIYTDSDLSTPAGADWYGQKISTSIYYAREWDGEEWVSGSFTEFDNTTYTKEGLLYTTSSSSTTCSVTLHAVWSDGGYDANTTEIWFDPFGCTNASAGRWIHPVGHLRRYYNGTIFTQTNTNWNKTPSYITIDEGNSGEQAKCFGTSVTLYTHPCDGSGGSVSTPAFNTSMPLLDSNFAWAPSKWYHPGGGTGGQSRYWNGTVGLWGDWWTQACPIGMMMK